MSAITSQWAQGAGPTWGGMGNLAELGLGAAAVYFGQPEIGLPLIASGLSGGQGQTAQTAQATPTGAGTQQQGGFQTLSAIAPATQSIMNAMGMNPQQRPQGATPQALQAPQQPTWRPSGQGLAIPPTQAPVQAAGAMSDVTAGAGTMAGMSQNPNLQQILAYLGRPMG